MYNVTVCDTTNWTIGERKDIIKILQSNCFFSCPMVMEVGLLETNTKSESGSRNIVFMLNELFY
jgi:hypothetical protein